MPLHPARPIDPRPTGSRDVPMARAADGALDRLARVAARLLGAPAALVWLVDEDGPDVAGATGPVAARATARHTPRTLAFCRHVAATGAPLAVPDARAHPLVQDGPAARDHEVAAYAGVPLTTATGHVLGALCVVADAPRAWSPDELAGLEDVACGVEARLELRAAEHALDRAAGGGGALRLDEARFRTVFESAAVGISIVDDAGRLLQVNAAFERFLGYDPGELIGRYAPELSPSGDAAVTRDVVADIRSGRRLSITVEKRFVRRDGEIRWATLTLSRVALGDGRAGILGMTIDVTDRRRVEADLERERAFLAATLESLSDGVVACDANGRLTLFNRATREFHGIHEEALPPEAWTGRYSLLRADGVTPLPTEEIPLLRALVGEEVRDAELVIAPTGRLARTVRASGRQIRDASGATLGAVVAMRDVTEQARAQAALRASEARFRAALEGGKFGFVVLAATRDAEDFVILAVNGHAARLIGMRERDLVGRRYGDLLPAGREAGHVEAYARVLATGEPHESEVRVTDQRFEAQWLRVQAVPLGDEDGDGAPDGVALLVRDVSDEKRAEEEARLLADVTGTLAAAPTLEAALGTVLEAMCQASRCEYGEVWIVEGAGRGEPGGRLVRGTVWHRPDDSPLACFAEGSDAVTFGRGEGMPGRAWAERQPVLLERLDAMPGAYLRLAAARAAGLRSAVAIPVLADGEVIAVMVFQARDPRRVGRAPVALLAAVAAQVGNVVRRKVAEAALAEREARLALIYNSATDLMFLMRVERDAAGETVDYRCESVNDAYLAVTGLARGELIGRSVAEILPAPAVSLAREKYALAERTGDVLRYDEAVDLPTGRVVVETTLTPVLDDRGCCTHLLGVARDVSATRRAQEALRESEARYRGVLENLRGPAVQLDAQGHVTFANEALLATTGWTAGETLGVDWFARFSMNPDAARAAFAEMIARGELVPHHESEVPTRDGDRRRVAWDNVLLRDGEGRVVGTASVGQDVTERRALETRLAVLSEHDELTGLLNRRGMRRMAMQSLKVAARTRRRDVVLCLDLDAFKPINDTYGHAAGDDALRAVADLIRATIRDADIGARLGGDEFAVYAVGLAENETGHRLAARLREKLAAHNDAAAVAGRPFRIECSIGVAELEPGDDLDTLLARGDAALYAEKLTRR